MNRPDLTEEAGLCATCRHSELVPGARSRFWLCGLSRTDDRFPRYPRLPILQCSGYEAVSESGLEVPPRID